MEISIKDLLKDVDYIEVDDEAKIDTEQNVVVFGSNGIGKTTIYHEIKKRNSDFDYLDYEETKDLFKKQKKKIEISLGINKLEELRKDIDTFDDILSTRNKLKNKKITSKVMAQSISGVLGKKYNEKIFSKIEISKDEFQEIKKVEQYIEYIMSHFDELQKIDDISEELKLVDQNYLKKALQLLKSKVDKKTTVCPVCNSPIYDLESIIQEKLNILSKIKNDCLKDFTEKYEFQMNGKTIKDEFSKVMDTVKNITEENVVNYYITDGNLETIKRINDAIDNKKIAEKEYNDLLKKQSYLFDSLVAQKAMYTNHLMNNYGVKVDFDVNNKIITLEFDRDVSTFSTGEINLILFITKLFSFLGSEKKLLVIDDPVSSYDLVNQYHIVFHLCKIINNDNKHVVIFTHNADVINVINSQNNSAYKYFFFDKVNGKLIMNALPNDMKLSSNVLYVGNIIKDTSIASNKYLSLIVERNDEDTNDVLSSVLHYDTGIVTLGGEAGIFKGCSNKFFIDYIEGNQYSRDLIDTDFKHLCTAKIIALTSIRVWIEYKLQVLSNTNLNGLFSKKVADFFKYNSNIQNTKPQLTREQLMNKKVMLNQNCHAKSQVQPFYYALSIKADDIKKEIDEIKSLFA